jgi:hypothetical protein
VRGPAIDQVIDQAIDRAIDPASVLPLIADLGFVARSDLPDRPGPAVLVVAIRQRPTLRHFDPELIEFWANDQELGRRHEITWTSPLPIDTDFSWGDIRITDRLQESNSYLTFGGRLMAAQIDGTVIAVFTSSVPILRRGGHSQLWDEGADAVGAFFGRVLLAVDLVPTFEARWGGATPVARYAAFVAETLGRYRASQRLREQHPLLCNLLVAAEARLKTESVEAWNAGNALLPEILHPVDRRRP